jgi:hypothetical protein
VDLAREVDAPLLRRLQSREGKREGRGRAEGVESGAVKARAV